MRQIKREHYILSRDGGNPKQEVVARPWVGAGGYAPLRAVPVVNQRPVRARGSVIVITYCPNIIARNARYPIQVAIECAGESLC